MGPVQAVKTCFAKYARFQGRARRSEIFWFLLLVMLVSMALFGLLVATESPVFGFVVVVWVLATLIPVWAVSCRRLHDRNLSGWWQLVQLIPLGFIVLLIMYVLKGDEAENRFGPPVLGAAS